MNKINTKRDGFIHLYNPKREGLGSYDVHYINANKRKRKLENNVEKIKRERYAA